MFTTLLTGQIKKWTLKNVCNIFLPVFVSWKKWSRHLNQRRKLTWINKCACAVFLTCMARFYPTWCKEGICNLSLNLNQFSSKWLLNNFNSRYSPDSKLACADNPRLLRSVKTDIFSSHPQHVAVKPQWNPLLRHWLWVEGRPTTMVEDASCVWDSNSDECEMRFKASPWKVQFPSKHHCARHTECTVTTVILSIRTLHNITECPMHRYVVCLYLPVGFHETSTPPATGPAYKVLYSQLIPKRQWCNKKALPILRSFNLIFYSTKFYL